MDRRVDYDRIASTYDLRYHRSDYSGVETALMAFVGEPADQRVLEVGCGTGHWLRALSGRGIRPTGLDTSAHMLSHARTHAPTAALVQGDAEYLPWPGGLFDRLFCINAFHHFEDKIAFLREGMRVLRSGGLIMIVGLDPHTGVDQWYIYDYFDHVLEIDRRRYPAAGQTRTWMETTGFVDCVTREIQHLPARLEAKSALEQGRLDKSATSQLSVLTDEEYRQGIERVRAAVAVAEARGESLYLRADLRLYATFGAAPAGVSG